VPNKVKIRLSHVGRTFVTGRGERVEAVKDVSLEVEDAFAGDGQDVGEFRVILGPSGCGKSTILRMIAGLDLPTTGEVTVDGQPVTGPGRDRGMVFQKYTSFPWLTVEENVAYGLRLMNAPDAERKATVAHLIQAVGLSGFERAYPDALSGGMQQRVAIARTLAVRPRVILMDEPFGALDAQIRSEMQHLLLTVWTESRSTILFVTHDVEEAVYLADRVIVMSSRPGTIVEEVPVPFSRPREPELKQRKEFRELSDYVLACLRRSPGSGQVRVSI
jgi:NitT/TauT family transport system ATP-binding protein